MKILSENSVLTHLSAPWQGRRFVSVAAGVFLGVALSLHGFHSGKPARTVVAQASEQTTPSTRQTTARKPLNWHQIGLASWYGPQFQGKQTADGEVFNMHDLTCAHRFLPLGTWLKVTNLHTHKWIVVRVNDRGPVPDTRIADLSSEAARMLGMRDRGVTRVRLDVIDSHQAREVARLDKLRLAKLTAQAEQPTASGN